MAARAEVVTESVGRADAEMVVAARAVVVLAVAEPAVVARVVVVRVEVRAVVETVVD